LHQTTRINSGKSRSTSTMRETKPSVESKTSFQTVYYADRRIPHITCVGKNVKSSPRQLEWSKSSIKSSNALKICKTQIRSPINTNFQTIPKQTRNEGANESRRNTSICDRDDGLKNWSISDRNDRDINSSICDRDDKCINHSICDRHDRRINHSIGDRWRYRKAESET
jgi:hypothetical protein